MITTEDLITKVKFGNNDKANIAVLARKGTLTLQQLANEKQIGDAIIDGDAQELPKVEIEFFNTRSIDVLIGALIAIKKNYVVPKEASKLNLGDYPYFDNDISQLALAC